MAGLNDANSSVVIMYGATPCHAGSGSSLGVVDLPIQRERHSNWPVIQASGMKGSLRAAFERFKDRIKEHGEIKKFDKLTESIFGTSDDGGYAGAMSVSDVKILAYPMRSSVAPFVWITCPSVLKRFFRDLKIAGKLDDSEQVKFSNMETDFKDSGNAITIYGEIEGSVLLEDFEVKATKDKNIGDISPLTEFMKQSERLLLVSDEVFDYGVTDCTQIMAQIKIDGKTGTTSDGSLRYQEELPSDTLMYSVVLWGDSKNSLEEKLKSETIKKFITEEVIPEFLQIGGDETCGRGIFELSWK